MTAEGAASPIRTLIYGSCVSRDTFEYLPRDEYTLVQYVARQSLVSAFTPAVTLLEPPRLDSAFQQRMVTGDFESSLPRVLERHAGAIDLILWDLTDERLGFYLLPDDTVVTRSVDLIASGGEGAVAGEGVLIKFGSDAHFAIWESMLAKLDAALRRRHPSARVVVLAPPWAELTESGEPTLDSFGLSAADANAFYRRYYDRVARAALETIGRDLTVRASEEHIWGEAPFHYTPATHLALFPRTRPSPAAASADKSGAPK